MTASMTAYTPAERRRVLLIGVGVPALILAAATIAVAATVRELPDPIATHWNGAGTPDGFGSVWGTIAVLVGVVGVFSLVASIATAWRPAATAPSRQARILIATSVWLAVFLTVGMGGSVLIQRGITDARDAGSVVPLLLAGFIGGLVLAVPAWFATPEPALADVGSEPAPSPMTLAPAERVTWSRRIGPSGRGWLLAGAVGVLVVGGAASAVAAEPSAVWATSIPVAAVLLVLASCLFWRVRIDTRGLAVTSVVGLPRFRISLDDITAVRSTEVSPLGEFGGWGVRWGGGRVGVIVRAGQALEVQRSSGRPFVVTVDDAPTAAALLGGLVNRRGGDAGS